MRGYTAQIPVKCSKMLHKNWQIPCILWPNPNTSCRFCSASIFHQSLPWWWSPESHIPTCFSTIFLFKCWYLHQCKHISTSPASSCFALPSLLWHSCLLGQCAGMWPFRYRRHSAFVFPPPSAVVFCGTSGWRRGGNMFHWENTHPLPCLLEQTSSLRTSSVASSWKGVAHLV